MITFLSSIFVLVMDMKWILCEVRNIFLYDAQTNSGLKTMSWFRRLATDFSEKKDSFYPGKIHVRFVVKTWFRERFIVVKLDPGEVCGGQTGSGRDLWCTKWFLERFSSQCFWFSLVVLFHRLSILTFILKIFLSGRQGDKTLEPSKKQCSSSYRSSVAEKIAFILCRSLKKLRKTSGFHYKSDICINGTDQ